MLCLCVCQVRYGDMSAESLRKAGKGSGMLIEYKAYGGGVRFIILLHRPSCGKEQEGRHFAVYLFVHTEH